MKKKNKNIFILALLIAILAPIWAVLSGHIGVSVGSVSLICAAIYGANQNQIKDAFKITLGLLMGDIWSYFSCGLIAKSTWNIDFTIFIVLFVFGIMAVVIASLLEKYFFLPAWLGGWAIGMTVLNMSDGTISLSLSIQVGVAMLIGVWYVGVFLDSIYQKLIK